MLIFIKHFLGSIVVAAVFVAGGYISIKLKWIQFTKLKLAFSYLITKGDRKKGGLSSFDALSAVLGGNLGTGNIAGIAVALTTGGPGALFWMWVMAFLGAIVKFVGCYLGVKYRQQSRSGLFVGGPMYYLAKGLNNKFLAGMFCIFTILSSLSVGNLAQVNSVAVPLMTAGIPPLVIGLGFGGLLGVILFGGLRFFCYIVALIVPFMATLYVLACLIVLWGNYQLIIPSLIEILNYALNPNSVLGGVAGYCIFDAIRVGFDRGLFATDAGVGLAPMLHAEVANTKQNLDEHGIVQGLISIIAPVIVMIICMLTGLVLMVTGAWKIDGLESTNICIKAFDDGLAFAYSGYMVIFILFLFAFTTMLTWAHCGRRAVEYFTDNKTCMNLYIIIYLLVIPVGVYSSVTFVWTAADIALNCMLLINLFAVVKLSPQIFARVTKFFVSEAQNC